MSCPVSIPSESLEYLRAKVTTQLDPTDGTVQFSLTDVDGDPVTWVAGEWEDDPLVTTNRVTAVARILIGPSGDLTPAEGKHAVWIKVTDAPEAPVRRVGVIRIT